jgi:hypothetical protein
VNAAVISGVVAIIVASATSLISHFLSRRQLEHEFSNQKALLRQQAVERRDDAQREYQLSAARSLRDAIGPVKTQIIEALNELTGVLDGVLKEPDEYYAWPQFDSDTPVRRTLVYRLARPLSLIEVLRQRRTYFDQALGSVIEPELRFFGRCERFELVYWEWGVLRNLPYGHEDREELIVGRRDISAAARALIVVDGSTRAVVSLETGIDDAAYEGIRPLEKMLVNLARRDRGADYKLSRLIAIKTAADALLEEFRLPYHLPRTATADATYLQQLSSTDIAMTMRRNLEEFLAVPVLYEAQDRMERDPHR